MGTTEYNAGLLDRAEARGLIKQAIGLDTAKQLGYLFPGTDALAMGVDTAQSPMSLIKHIKEKNPVAATGAAIGIPASLLFLLGSLVTKGHSSSLGSLIYNLGRKGGRAGANLFRKTPVDTTIKNMPLNALDRFQERFIYNPIGQHVEKALPRLSSLSKNMLPTMGLSIGGGLLEGYGEAKAMEEPHGRRVHK